MKDLPELSPWNLLAVGILVCSSLLRGAERVLWRSNSRGDVILVSAEGHYTRSAWKAVRKMKRA